VAHVWVQSGLHPMYGWHVSSRWLHDRHMTHTQHVLPPYVATLLSPSTRDMWHTQSYCSRRHKHTHAQVKNNACTCTLFCWLLLGNQNVKGPYMYLEAEVVEEVMGWLG